MTTENTGSTTEGEFAALAGSLSEGHQNKPERSEANFDGYAMYPHDISLLLDRLGAEFPDEMSALDMAIMDQCKTIMRENKAHWERFGIHGGAEAPAPQEENAELCQPEGK